MIWKRPNEKKNSLNRSEAPNPPPPLTMSKPPKVRSELYMQKQNTLRVHGPLISAWLHELFYNIITIKPFEAHSSSPSGQAPMKKSRTTCYQKSHHRINSKLPWTCIIHKNQTFDTKTEKILCNKCEKMTLIGVLVVYMMRSFITTLQELRVPKAGHTSSSQLHAQWKAYRCAALWHFLTLKITTNQSD